MTEVVGPAHNADSEEPAKATSADWEKVARDPFVQRVREAVDGTLFDVRSARRTSEPESAADEVEDAADDS